MYYSAEIERSLLEIKDQLNRQQIIKILKWHGRFSRMLHKKGKPRTPGFDEYNVRDIILNAIERIENERIEAEPFVDAFMDIPVNFPDHLEQLFQIKHAEGKRIAMIMAPIFNKNNIVDGYYRRIKAIDDLLGDNFYKIYASPFGYSWEKPGIKCRFVDDLHLTISYDLENLEQQNIIRMIGDSCDLVYHHSVGYLNKLVLRNPNLIKIVDLHGALPEEQKMYEKYLQSQIDGERERIATEKADYIVCVTDAMSNHIRKKYPHSKSPHIILPIFDDGVLDFIKNNQLSAFSGSKPIVTYAGGLQKWQLVPLMQELIEKTKNMYEYRIFVPDPAAFLSSWPYEAPPDFLVESRSVEELQSEYKQCQYGLCLREESTVNTVACPTKLVEYLAAGIVPVLHSTQLGDFVRDGMKYISLMDFAEGNIPSEKSRLDMAEENKKVLIKMVQKHSNGLKELRKIFEMM